MQFLNHATGEILEVSPLELRLSRLKKRLAFYGDWVQCVDLYHGDLDNIMITLTYAGVDDWRAKHITEFIRKIKRRLGAKMYGYYWVAEMQRRGAVHYHVVVSVEKGVRLPKLDDVGLWVHGMTKIELVRKSVQSYLGKYLSKGSGVPYPQGIRIFGSSVYILKNGEANKNTLPVWLKKKVHAELTNAITNGDTQSISTLLDNSQYKKVTGGWRATKHHFASPYANQKKKNMCATT